jgi:hypothetical protein
MLLHILYGMLFGYLLASFRFASILVKKGYRSIDQIPDFED